jgi:hypothetical protein
MILPKPSVSPLPSWASRPTPTHQVPSFTESLEAIWRGLRGVRQKPTLHEMFRQQRLIEKLAEEIEIEENGEAATGGEGILNGNTKATAETSFKHHRPKG